MNKLALAEKLAEKLNLNKRLASECLESLIALMTEELKNGKEVRLSGFGIFSVRVRHGRRGVNPQNPSEAIDIPAVKIAKFRTGKTLRDALKK